MHVHLCYVLLQPTFLSQVVRSHHTSAVWMHLPLPWQFFHHFRHLHRTSVSQCSGGVLAISLVQQCQNPAGQLSAATWVHPLCPLIVSAAHCTGIHTAAFTFLVYSYNIDEMSQRWECVTFYFQVADYMVAPNQRTFTPSILIISKILGQFWFPVWVRCVTSATHLVTSVVWYVQETFPLNIQPGTDSWGAKRSCASVQITS